jgi:hypothetical protein
MIMDFSLTRACFFGSLTLVFHQRPNQEQYRQRKNNNEPPKQMDFLPYLIVFYFPHGQFTPLNHILPRMDDYHFQASANPQLAQPAMKLVIPAPRVQEAFSGDET